MIISWSPKAPETVKVKKKKGEKINYVCGLVILKVSLSSFYSDAESCSW